MAPFQREKTEMERGEEGEVRPLQPGWVSELFIVILIMGRQDYHYDKGFDNTKGC